MKRNIRKRLLLILGITIIFLLSISFYRNYEIKKPTAELSYSTKILTNENVTVELINPSTDIIITNNKGKNTYTFQENGSFTFEFKDKRGHKGSVTANVNWIDKTPPTAIINYDRNELTNQNVTATITNFSEDVDIINNEGKNTYTFEENGEFVFEIQDKAGNIANIPAKVECIDKIKPISFISFTKGDTPNTIIASLSTPTEDIIILNNEGKNTYTFQENGSFEFIYQDQAGNESTTVARVNWLKTNKKNQKSKKNNEKVTIKVEEEPIVEEQTTEPTLKTETEENPTEDIEKLEEPVRYENQKNIFLIDLSLIICIFVFMKIKTK